MIKNILIAAMTIFAAVAPAFAGFPTWRWDDDDYRADSQWVGFWGRNDTSSPIPVTTPRVRVSYDGPMNLIAEQTLFWSSDSTASPESLLNLVLWTETDAGIIAWGAPPPGPWDFGGIHPYDSSILYFAPDGITFIEAWATFDIRPGETVIAGQFLQSQSTAFRIPEPAVVPMFALVALVVALRRPRRMIPWQR